MSPEILPELRDLASDAAKRAFVPYSRRAEAVILLLSDGVWIPGVRVESATFSLTIPPLVNAVTTAVALERTDIVAAVASRPIHPAERAFAALSPVLQALQPVAFDVLANTLGDEPPRPVSSLSPFVTAIPPVDTEIDDVGVIASDAGAGANRGIGRARSIAERAYVPESAFPVGCVIELEDDELVPGVNVEHPDWAYILCAERNALGTCVSYGRTDIETVWVACLQDENGTPCGACRQLLVELAPTATLWMDRGKLPPTRTDPASLLPGAFSGAKLTPNT